jgi:hypothetical protein
MGDAMKDFIKVMKALSDRHQKTGGEKSHERNRPHETLCG